MDAIIDAKTRIVAGVDEEGGEPTLTIETPGAHVDMGSVVLHFACEDEEIVRMAQEIMLNCADIYSAARRRIEARG